MRGLHRRERVKRFILPSMRLAPKLPDPKHTAKTVNGSVSYRRSIIQADAEARDGATPAPAPAHALGGLLAAASAAAWGSGVAAAAAPAAPPAAASAAGAGAAAISGCTAARACCAAASIPPPPAACCSCCAATGSCCAIAARCCCAAAAARRAAAAAAASAAAATCFLRAASASMPLNSFCACKQVYGAGVGPPSRQRGAGVVRGRPAGTQRELPGCTAARPVAPSATQQPAHAPLGCETPTATPPAAPPAAPCLPAAAPARLWLQPLPGPGPQTSPRQP